MNTHHFPLKKGQELLEYAIIAPIFLVILLVIFDLGRVTYTYSVVQNAAREGARYGAIHPADWTGIQTAVNRLALGVQAQSPQVVVYEDSLQMKTIQVCVLADFHAITPVISALLGTDPITLHGCSSMHVEE
jgi:Flp pilus assembly protein TadG